MNNHSKSLALVSHFFAGHGGGVEIVAWEIAKQLALLHQMEIHWISSATDSASPGIGIHPVPMRTFNGVERRTGIPYPIWGPLSVLRMARIIRDVDVVHIHDCLYMGNILAYLIAKLLRKPILVTQHIGPVPFRNRLLQGTHELMNRLLGRLVLSGADQCVFYSSNVRRYFESRVPFRRRPQLISNGVDITLFKPPTSSEVADKTRMTLGLTVDRPMILFVGRFVEKKGLHLLKQMAARTPDFQWVFAGQGVLDPRNWGLRNVTVHHGRRQASLVPLYHASDLMVLPSVGEGFPLVVQEALACGTPALVSDDIPQALPEAAGLIFSAMSPVNRPQEVVVAAWLNQLESLLKDRRALRQGAVARAAGARRLWSWDRCGQAYGRILEELTTHRRGLSRNGKSRHGVQ